MAGNPEGYFHTVFLFENGFGAFSEGGKVLRAPLVTHILANYDKIRLVEGESDGESYEAQGQEGTAVWVIGVIVLDSQERFSSKNVKAKYLALELLLIAHLFYNLNYKIKRAG